jgi:hypothetical protein
MNPLEVVALTPLMEYTSGRREIVIGLLDGPGATHWFGAARGDTVKGDGGCLQTAGHWAVGSPARPFCGPVGELFGPPYREIYRTCAQRHRTEKLPEKSQQVLYKGLAATQSRVTWSNPREI